MRTTLIILVMALSVPGVGADQQAINSNFQVSCTQKKCLEKNGVKIEEQADGRITFFEKKSRRTDSSWNIYATANRCLFPEDQEKGNYVFLTSLGRGTAGNYSFERHLNSIVERNGESIHMSAITFKESIDSKKNKELELCQETMIMSEDTGVEGYSGGEPTSI